MIEEICAAYGAGRIQIINPGFVPHIQPFTR